VELFSDFSMILTFNTNNLNCFVSGLLLTACK